jgi:hypothetical protein
MVEFPRHEIAIGPWHKKGYSNGAAFLTAKKEARKVPLSHRGGHGTELNQQSCNTLLRSDPAPPRHSACLSRRLPRSGMHPSPSVRSESRLCGVNSGMHPSPVLCAPRSRLCGSSLRTASPLRRALCLRSRKPQQNLHGSSRLPLPLFPVFSVFALIPSSAANYPF